MIVDTELYASTGPGSHVKILCRCDSCGMDRLVFKVNLTRRGDTLCLKCARNVNNWWRGRTLSEEHRASIKRTWKPRPLSPEGLESIAANWRGAGNPRWNPDRAAVAKNELARQMHYGMLWRTLYRLGRSKEKHTDEALGYSAAELAAHLEALFEPGMSWADRSAWHIDHIKPVREFVREGVTDPAIINALSNLRPLWAKENLSLAGQRYGRNRKAA